MKVVSNKPSIFACIPAYNWERAIGGIVVWSLRFVDRVVVFDDGSKYPIVGACARFGSLGCEEE